MERFGIFETVRVENGKPILIEYHYRRFKRSSTTLNIPFHFSFEEFTRKVVEAAGDGTKLVRIALFKNRQVEINVRTCRKRNAVTLLPISSIKRCFSPLTLHKTVDIMDSLFAIKEAQKRGYDEALIFDEKGFVSETAFANIFFYSNGTLFTPSLKTGCLPGTRREFIKNLCRNMGIPLIEGFFHLDDLLSADEIFITSAREDVCPVVRIKNFPIKEPPGKPLFKRILEIMEGTAGEVPPQF